MGCPLVVHYWADLQSVHGFRCYDNIAPNAECQRVLVLALYARFLLEIKLAIRRPLSVGYAFHFVSYHVALFVITYI